MKQLLFLVLLLLSKAAFSQKQQPIPFQLMESGHILVKAKVDGVEGSFIFDTGAGLTVFTKKFFDKLPRAVPEDGGFTAFRATGERVDVDLYLVNNFELGSLKQAVTEISYLDFNLGGIDGIISLKLLEKQPFTIDFDNKVIRLESAPALAKIKRTGSSIPLQLEQSRGRALDIFAYFKVNDSLTLQLCLDSGAGKDVYKLNSKYMQRLGIDVNDTMAVKRKTRKSEINAAFVTNIYTAPVKKLTAASSPEISVTDFKAQFVDGLIYDGIMWINWLGRQITVDLEGKEMVVVR